MLLVKWRGLEIMRKTKSMEEKNKFKEREKLVSH